MTWRRYIFEGFLTHVVPSSLEFPFALEMTARNADLMVPSHGENPRTITEWGFDRGGGCHLHRPYEEFTWAGLAISVPSQDVAHIVDRLSALELRRFACGTAYRKLKVWHHATVMTPEQAEDLCLLLTARLATARVRDEEFHAAIRRADAQGGPS
jgi:hypothetical protein